ncbi:M20 aminoacylase family protein [Pragia fontium]|uniref:Hippurate hydrolase n=2 Tax=Pragia fontium TaxID=82985 RepID=A0AAJ5BID4_9GAMM|nr:M20 aminoacylase family protein [Pragia fontium]AKJ40731.1 hypothetical protein QQ39_00475 [Pragia fontium]SFD31234.1 hippurate hydrolase [Pragia fontium DSM 5563 = ATCC 49100]SUB80896.1 Uncharacterized hydrolase YxeP [Pragia fontium]VEJ52708.1 Uncharacterized hydrolase YxeP [Pragia fontium]GKX63704.1 hydrolase [Pragia fontium]
MYQELDDWFDDLKKIRHDLHAHPEIGFDTVRTSDIVARYLTEWGYDVHRGIGKTGVVGQLKCGSGTKTIGLRADMDALPMQEVTGLSYASTIPGSSHSCGHDGNTTMLLAGARLLAKRKNFNGTLNVIFQPAEEGQGGSVAMIKDRLFERFPCDYVFALHSMPNAENNKLFYVQPGAVLSSSDRITITIKGCGGHGAEPQNTVDPVLVGSAVVQALQSIVSRNTAPKERAVVTVASFLAGREGSYNIIPETARLLLSVRSMDNVVRTMILQNIQRIATDVCRAFGAEAEVEHHAVAPAVINDAFAANLAREAAISVFSEEDCPASFQPYMNSEDFAYMLEACPGAYAMLNNGKTPNCHQPDYDFNDDLILRGGAYWTALTERYLEDK